MSTHDYEVSIRNTFEAKEPYDAVRQMVEWLQGDVASYGYRVIDTDLPDAKELFIDGDDAFAGVEYTDEVVTVHHLRDHKDHDIGYIEVGTEHRKVTVEATTDPDDFKVTVGKSLNYEGESAGLHCHDCKVDIAYDVSDIDFI